LPVAPARRNGSSRRTARDAEQRVAAIDIGSNSIRQVVADVSSDGAIRVVDEMKSAPRLGAGLSSTGELNQAAMGRAVETLTRMSTLARQLGASRLEAVATSAVREARNGRDFIDLARRKASLNVRVLSGDEEARLCFLSALAHFEIGNGRAVVIDIGGGSLELALSADGVVEHLESLPLGAIRATEQFLGPEPKRRSLEKLRETTRAMLRSSVPLKDWRGAQCIGSGGTFTNLAGIYLQRSNIRTPRSVHGTYVPHAEVEHILDHLHSLTPAQRLGVPGLNAGRADIIVAGLAVAAETLAYFRSRGVLSSAYGIREGLLLKMARVTPSSSDAGKARERSLVEFARRCHYEERHARHVRQLALRLFDALGKRLGCAPEDRQLLSEAAILHEVGYHISYNRHHKHAYHLIMHAEFLGMSPEEQIVVANVARYHRGAAPRKKHENFGSLDKPLRERIRRLSALLRVADGFDRGHSGVVQRVNVRRLDRAVRLTPVARNERERGLRLAAWGASRKAGLLARLAGVPVEIVAPDGVVFSTAEAVAG
jgi:exopolyphosphatase/guanosine-5'-triphosphate,3'-diphosphate pyrophosphatase